MIQRNQVGAGVESSYLSACIHVWDGNMQAAEGEKTEMALPIFDPINYESNFR